MKFQAGDAVVYHKRKVSTRPGPRAEDVKPAPRGEEYFYAVDKYWLVRVVNEDQTLEVVTRTGKVHRLTVDDPCLRKANLLERLFRRGRFPDLESLKEPPERDG